MNRFVRKVACTDDAITVSLAATATASLPLSAGQHSRAVFDQ